MARTAFAIKAEFVKRSGMPELTFVVPVKPKAVSSDWSLVLRNLHATVRSLLGSKDPDFRILLASHDPLELSKDARIQSHIVDFPLVTEVKSGIRDKQAKLRFLAALLRSRSYEGYIMLLDADDLVSNKLVGYIRSDDNKRGYLLRQGLRLDVTNSNLRFQKSGFDKSCGSCFIGYFLPEELPLDHRDRSNYFSKFLRHTECFEAASEHGREPEIVKGAAVVYVTNHEDSLRMARLDGRIRTVADQDNLPNAVEILREEFSYELAPVLPLV